MTSSPDTLDEPKIEAFDQSLFDSGTDITFGGVISGKGQTLIWRDCARVGLKKDGNDSWTQYSVSCGKVVLKRGFSALIPRPNGGELREI